MKAYVRDRYGSPDILEVRDVEEPEVADDGVLVQVRAASVNAYDWHLLRGKPYIARLSEGLRRPKTARVGVDLAGVAERIGKKVTHVQPGDHVFGARSGAFAEYVAGKNMVRMPAGLTFEQAAAAPTAALTALQGLRDHGGIRDGQRVLINGAGGGVGTMAVQLARAYDADVTAVTSAGNVDLVRSLGADTVIDYTREDFAAGGRRYDLVLDVGGNRRLSVLRGVLTPDGTAVLVAPQTGQWIGPIIRMIGAKVTSRLSRQKTRSFLATVNRADLQTVADLIQGGRLMPVIDRTYRFVDVPAAIRHVEEGRARGKVVITVSPPA